MPIETLTQVRRLAPRRCADQPRFEELDAQTGEVMAALRNVDSQRAFIRSNRDWLYRSQRAWEPILGEWERQDECPRERLSTPIGSWRRASCR